MIERSVKIALLSFGLMLLGSVTAQAAEKTVTIGYQLIVNPANIGIVDGTFEKVTGWKIDWRRFDSGAKVIAAMASGDVQIAVAGSSPTASAVSQGVGIELFYVLDNIARSEALVARNGSGIAKVEDLKGKKVAVPFVSTSHFSLLTALKHFGVDPKDVQILNMQPPQVVAAWERGDIDAAFVWPPALTKILESGKEVINAEDIGKLGAPTFDAWVVQKSFAKENPDFVVKFVKTLDSYNKAYNSNPGAYAADSEQVKAIAQSVGENPKEVPGELALYKFPSVAEQASCEWLGCGANGGVAKSLTATAGFLVEQKKIQAAKDDYSQFVNSSFAEMALKQ